jgi:hypothetical protein
MTFVDWKWKSCSFWLAFADSLMICRGGCLHCPQGTLRRKGKFVFGEPALIPAFSPGAGEFFPHP